MRGRNHLAVIQHQPTIPSDFTGTGGEWTEFAVCFADVRPLRGQELFNAQQVQAQVTHSIETEFVYDVKPKMRVKIVRDVLVNVSDITDDANCRFFEITAAINVNEANRSLEMLCIEKI